MNKDNQSEAEILRQKAELLLNKKTQESASPFSEIEMLRLIHELEVHQVELVLQNDELRRAREVAEVATSKYTNLYEFAPSGYFTLSTVSEIIELNITGTQMLGKDRSKLINHKFTHFVSPETRPVFNLFLEKVFQSKLKETCEVKLLTDGDNPTYFMLTGIITKDPNQCNITMVDITERKRAEEALKESEERFRTIFENSMVGKSLTYIDGTVKTNLAFCEIVGYSEEELSRLKWQTITHPDDVSRDEGVVKSLLSGEKLNVRWEKRYIRKNGDLVWVDISTSLQSDKQGKPLYFITSIIDITERKQAEEALQKSEIAFRLLAESMPQIVWVTDPAGMNIYFNQQWVDYTGLTLEESYGNGWNKPFHPDDQLRAWKAWQNATKHGSTYSLECRLRRADGEYTWWLVRGVPVYNSKGTVIKWFGTCTDIHEFKQKERELYQTKAILNSAMDQSQAGIAIADAPDGKLRYVNDAGLLIRGGNRQDVISGVGVDQYVASWKMLDFDGTPLKPDQVPLARAILFGETNSREFIIRRDVDDDRIVLAKAAPIRDENGIVVSAIVVFLDITEQKQAENEIHSLNETLENRIAERTKQLETVNKELIFHLSELEQFSYVSNHDLQEPLRTLTQFTKLFNEKYAGKLDVEGEKYLEFISKSAVRMKLLVKDLLDYSLLGKESVKTIVDCNEIVEEILCDLDDSIKGSSAKLTIQKLPILNGYKTELRLLFQNLVGNAIKYQIPDVVPEIHISSESHEKEWLFSIKDNGIGIDQKHYERIFIIFQRLHNRDEFEGTGIGLAHCKKIVELHGGRIWVESTLGIGSAFMFTIPKQ
jgi:PAS domain S-box-containing protein